MSNDIEQNPEASALRGKRAQRGPKSPPAGTTVLTRAEEHPAPPAPVSVQAAMAHKSLMLFDPTEPLIVVESAGLVPDAILRDRYEKSEFDATESVVPPGCTTAISRTLWRKGQHIRRDVYNAYVRKYRTDPEG